MKGAKSIAEYAIRKWLEEQGFKMEYFTLHMNGNKATLEDRYGDKMIVSYNRETHRIEISLEE